ncbi:MAG: glycosyltransferase [Solirubrobacterales bacterium]
MSARPSVSVIVPFAGGPRATRSLLEGLARLRLGADDELIVVDNSPTPAVEAPGGGPAPPPEPARGPGSAPRIVRATAERSSYYARNAGAERATGSWLLFMDADCRPEPDLLDRHFAEPVDPCCALIAGGIVGDPRQRGLVPAWARSRRQLSQDHLIPGPPSLPHSAAGTPNLMVRRDVFEALGGFHEGIRSAGDVELCWRIQDSGWEMDYRPAARVHPRYRRRLGSLLSQSVRHAAGHRWLSRRYPGSYCTPPVLRAVGRSALAAAALAATLQPRRALYKLIDGLVAAAGAWGWWLGVNAVAPTVTPSEERGVRDETTERRAVIATDAFPARSETFVYNEAKRLRDLGWRLRIESLARPVRTERPVARSFRTDYLEDDAPRHKLCDLAWLLAHHPLGCLRDFRARRRWSQAEEVWPLAAIAPAARRLATEPAFIHAHFAAGGALVALRISRLLGLPYGLTAHAYDIFQQPRNLPEKLGRASFVAAECDYTAEHLRELTNTPVHRIATGVDFERFARRRPTPDRGRVVAVGRLVEKKGFEHLVRAAALLEEGGPAGEIEIAGEGPLGGRLRALIAELGVAGRVKLLGPTWGPEAVRDLLESADLLVVPSVIAADGDRDALPLVAYEGLAMELPILASDLVGLPELVQPPRGRLVEPGDPEALAGAIAEALSQPVAERRAAGARGREHLLEHFDPERATARLAELMEGGP